MKQTISRYFGPIGVLIFLALCLVPNGQAQASGCTPLTRGIVPPYQVATVCTFTSTSSRVTISSPGITYWRVIALPAGTISACTLSLDSSANGTTFTTGGVIAAATIGSCASAGMYVATTATTPTLFAGINPSVTGSGTLTVVLLGYVNKPKV